MNNNLVDWRFLRGALIFLLLAIIVAAALAYFGLLYEEQRAGEYRQQETRLTRTHRKYEQLVRDLDLMEQYTNLFNEYKSSGLVGDERRLSWIESLEAVNSRLRLPKLAYNLMPQEDFRRPGFKPPRFVSVKSSPMQVTMELLHEGDLFSLMDGLEQEISNLFTVDSCRLRLKGQVGKLFDTRKPNLTGECVIRWITIDVSKK
jgi:hypothetical protein